MSPKSLAASALLAWYYQNGRALPWRRGPGSPLDPYAVMVSEFMLQQTRTATVAPYFSAWMSRFPDLVALAAASSDDVLAAWSGLGYYSRARNLHASARRIVAQYGGHIPSEASTLRSLPGFGAYTAGAVASIAFGRPEPALDGNAIRVLARLTACEQDAGSAEGRRQLEAAARQLLDGSDAPGDVNQALMDLGNVVCRARDPRCDECPLRSQCAAFATDSPEAFPPRAARRAPRTVNAFAYVLERPESRWLVVRERGGLLAGLWGFPLVTIQPGQSRPTPGQGLRIALGSLGPFATSDGSAERSPGAALREHQAGYAPVPDDAQTDVDATTGASLKAAPIVRHVFSHMRLTAEPFHGAWPGATRYPADSEERQWQWRTEAELKTGPVSRLTIKLLEAVRQSRPIPTGVPSPPHSAA